MDKLIAVLFGLAIFLVAVAFFSLLPAAIAYWVFNGIVAVEFGLKPVSFWACWGVLLLLGMVFGKVKSTTRVSK